jgi:hypothetical protein
VASECGTSLKTKVGSAHTRGGALGGGSPPNTPGSPVPSLGELSFRPRRIRVIIQIAPATTAAPISAQAQPGRPLDSEDGSLLAAAAAPAAAAAGAWLVDVVVVVVGVVGVVGVVTVCVLRTVFVCVCVGVVTVVVCGGWVTVFVWVTVLVWDGAVLVVVGVVGVAAALADFVCADAVAVWFWEGWVSVLACVAVGVLTPVLAVVPAARLEAV